MIETVFCEDRGLVGSEDPVRRFLGRLLDMKWSTDSVLRCVMRPSRCETSCCCGVFSLAGKVLVTICSVCLCPSLR